MHLSDLAAGKGLELMISKYFRLAAAATIILFALSGGLSAQNTPGMPPMPPQPPKMLPFVSTLFGDNMVLQRGKANTVWGWSEPGDKVTVQIGDTAATGIAGADRRWQVTIQPPPAGGPYTVKITGHDSVELHNVLVGDVWLCGGQSNMGLPLRFTRNGADEAKTANYPQIRFFTVTGHPAYHHTDVVGGKWSEVTPQSADWVSAVAY
jgi:sialate O-acetylesterase